MLKRSPCLLRFAALTAWAAMALGQTPAMLTLYVKTPDGVAVQNADVMIQSAQPQFAFRFKAASSTSPACCYVTKTNAEGQAQADKAGLEKAFQTRRVVVSVRAAGYEPYKQNFELADQKALQIVLHPLPPQQ